MRTYTNLLSILIFISFANLNVAMDGICDVRINMLQSLAKDGFLRNHLYLSQWFHRKYPRCSPSNYANIIIGEIENVKENNGVLQNHLMKDGNFDRNKEISVKTNDDEVYHQRYDGDKVNKHLFTLSRKDNNVNVDSNKKAVILKKIINNGMNEKDDGRYNIEKRRLNIGKSLIGEWNEQSSGTYILSKDVNTSKSIMVLNALTITGIVGMDGKRPAIDGGGTPGCTDYNGCPGHTVFQGGGLDIDLNAVVVLTSCTLTGNTAQYGGGMHIDKGDVTIIDSHFGSNTCRKVVEGCGSDIYTVSPTIIINTTFSIANSNSIQGNPHQCTPGICQQIFQSYPNDGIDCKNNPYKQGMKCFPCHPGKYLTENAPYPSCLPCLAGKATNKYGSASCDTCSPGKIQPINTIASSCKLCGAGTYSNNSIACIDIPPGMYPSNCHDTSNKKGCSVIKPCLRGFYCPLKTTIPIQCLQGYYSNITGAPICLKCNSGRASNILQATECTECKMGQFATNEGMKHCESCTDGHTTYNKGSTTCSECTIGKAGTNGICSPCITGKYQDEAGTINCKECPSGKQSAKTTCTSCNAGKYLDGRNCKSCSSGKFSIAGSAKCLDCPKGKWAKSKIASPSCIDCPAGFYGLVKGQTNQSDACKVCGKGKFSSAIGADSDKLCNDCPLGTASNVEGANTSDVCKLCKKGKVANVTGSEQCYYCKMGYIPSKGGTQCQACSTGTHEVNDKCEPCSKGKSQSNIGKNICNICLPGQYSNFKGLPTCLQCSPGQAIDSKNNTQCSLCEKGKFTNSAGSLKCTTCEAGMTTFVEGSVQCSDCPKGKVGRNGNCDVCPFGKVARTDGTKVCQPCNVGFQPGKYNISCVKMDVNGSPPTSLSIKMGPNRTTLFVKWKLPSDVITPDDRVVIVPVDRVTNDDVYQSVWYGPAVALNAMLLNVDVYKKVYTLKISILHKKDGSTSPNTTYSETWQTTSDCSTDGTYLNATSHDLADWKCNKCPRGASCQGPITWNDVKARFGNWHVPNTYNFNKCIRPQSCLGAANNLYYERFPTLAKHDHNVSCAAPGFVQGSRLCATCARPEFARGTSKGSCVKCHKTWNIIILIGSIVFGLVGFTLLLRMTLFQRKDIKLSDGIKKIAINYLQFASLALNLDMPWTDVLRELFKWQSYGVGVSNALISLDCVLADTHTTWQVFQWKFYGTLLMPIGFIPIAYMIVKGVLRGGRKEFIASLILFWYLMYPQIVKILTKLVSCTDVNGTKYLIVDPEVECFAYNAFVWCGILFGCVVYVIGMPLIGFSIVKHLDRNAPDNRLRFGILYDGYDSTHYWWWEIVIQVRKLGVILISALVESRVQQILLVLFVIVISLFFTAWLRPFYDDRLVRMEMLSLIVCFLTFFFGSMLLSDEKCVENEEFLCVLAQWLVIFINAACVLFLGINFSQNWFVEKRDMFGKLVRKCNCCCKDEEGRLQRRESYFEMQQSFDEGDGGDVGLFGDDALEQRDGEYHQL